jgi:hypothetical protein
MFNESSLYLRQKSPKEQVGSLVTANLEQPAKNLESFFLQQRLAKLKTFSQNSEEFKTINWELPAASNIILETGTERKAASQNKPQTETLETPKKGIFIQPGLNVKQKQIADIIAKFSISQKDSVIVIAASPDMEFMKKTLPKNALPLVEKYFWTANAQNNKIDDVKFIVYNVSNIIQSTIFTTEQKNTVSTIINEESDPVVREAFPEFLLAWQVFSFVITGAYGDNKPLSTERLLGLYTQGVNFYSKFGSVGSLKNVDALINLLTKVIYEITEENLDLVGNQNLIIPTKLMPQYSLEKADKITGTKESDSIIATNKTIKGNLGIGNDNLIYVPKDEIIDPLTEGGKSEFYTGKGNDAIIYSPSDNFNPNNPDIVVQTFFGGIGSDIFSYLLPEKPTDSATIEVNSFEKIKFVGARQDFGNLSHPRINVTGKPGDIVEVYGLPSGARGLINPQDGVQLKFV